MDLEKAIQELKAEQGKGNPLLRFGNRIVIVALDELPPHWKKHMANQYYTRIFTDEELAQVKKELGSIPRHEFLSQKYNIP